MDGKGIKRGWSDDAPEAPRTKRTRRDGVQESGRVRRSTRVGQANWFHDMGRFSKRVRPLEDTPAQDDNGSTDALRAFREATDELLTSGAHYEGGKFDMFYGGKIMKFNKAKPSALSYLSKR